MLRTIAEAATAAPDLGAQAESFATRLLLGAVSVLATVIVALWRHALGQAKEARTEAAAQIKDLKAEHANEIADARKETERWQAKYEAEHHAHLATKTAATEALLHSAKENREGIAHLYEIAQAVKR